MIAVHVAIVVVIIMVMIVMDMSCMLVKSILWPCNPVMLVVWMLVDKAFGPVFGPVEGEVVVMEDNLCQSQILQEMLEALEGHIAIITVLVKDHPQEEFMFPDTFGGLLGLQAGHRT